MPLESPLQLPESYLPVQNITATFRNTTASYKYYWFLSILNLAVKTGIKTEGGLLHKEGLLAEMFSMVWYPIHYYRLSFGPADQLSNVTDELFKELNIERNVHRSALIRRILDLNFSTNLEKLYRYVPYRFLRSWFPSLAGIPDVRVNKEIEILALEKFHNPDFLPMYKFSDDGIILQPRWHSYLQKHYSILFDYGLWELLSFVQKRNPNVPGLSTKLFDLPERVALTEQRKIWKDYLDGKSFSCIFTGENVSLDDFALDHFIPRSYISHDQMWNLHPMRPGLNLAKSDSLPRSVFIEKLAEVHYDLINTEEIDLKNSFKEEYVILFRTNSFSEIKSSTWENFLKVYHDQLSPQLDIARNMGFTPWQDISPHPKP